MWVLYVYQCYALHPANTGRKDPTRSHIHLGVRPCAGMVREDALPGPYTAFCASGWTYNSVKHNSSVFDHLLCSHCSLHSYKVSFFPSFQTGTSLLSKFALYLPGYCLIWFMVVISFNILNCGICTLRHFWMLELTFPLWQLFLFRPFYQGCAMWATLQTEKQY